MIYFICLKISTFICCVGGGCMCYSVLMEVRCQHIIIVLFPSVSFLTIEAVRPDCSAISLAHTMLSTFNN